MHLFVLFVFHSRCRAMIDSTKPDAPRVWTHCCSYDVSNTTAAQQHIKLVHIDPNTHHTLVIVLNRQSNIPLPMFFGAKSKDKALSKRLSFNSESFADVSE